MLKAQGKLDEAVKAYQNSLAIAEQLTRIDPDNPGWQRQLAFTHWKIALVLAEQGQTQGALDALQKGRAIFARLKEGSPEDEQLGTVLAEFDAKIETLKNGAATAPDAAQAEQAEP